MGNLFDKECKEKLTQCKKNNIDVRHLLLDLNQLIRNENVTKDTVTKVIDDFVSKNVPAYTHSKKYSFTHKGGRRKTRRNGFF